MNTTELATLKDRSGLGFWLNYHGLVGTMAEIGVAFGGFSLEVLRSWTGKKYLMVDPWVIQPKSIYRENTSGIPYDSWHSQCVDISRKDPRVSIMRGFSVEMAEAVPNKSLDVAYIDANHSRQAFSEDMAAWLPKVKSGGILCGHDYYNSTEGGHYCQVKDVVDEWAKQYGWKILSTPCSSWWTVVS